MCLFSNVYKSLAEWMVSDSVFINVCLEWTQRQLQSYWNGTHSYIASIYSVQGTERLMCLVAVIRFLNSFASQRKTLTSWIFTTLSFSPVLFHSSLRHRFSEFWRKLHARYDLVLHPRNAIMFLNSHSKFPAVLPPVFLIVHLEISLMSTETTPFHSY